MTPLFIAEVKTKSPFGFESEHDQFALLRLALEHGDIVAAHTEPEFGGSDLWLRTVVANAHMHKKLVLAKGYHRTDKEIVKSLNTGANLVLVVGRQPPPELAPVCIWEPLYYNDFVRDKAPRQMICWNERDLQSGKRKLNHTLTYSIFEEARKAHSGFLVQASFIKTREDVHPRTDAFIVGEHLPEFVEADICPAHIVGINESSEAFCSLAKGHEGKHRDIRQRETWAEWT